MGGPGSGPRPEPEEVAPELLALVAGAEAVDLGSPAHRKRMLAAIAAAVVRLELSPRRADCLREIVREARQEMTASQIEERLNAIEKSQRALDERLSDAREANRGVQAPPLDGRGKSDGPAAETPGEAGSDT